MVPVFVLRVACRGALEDTTDTASLGTRAPDTELLVDTVEPDTEAAQTCSDSVANGLEGGLDCGGDYAQCGDYGVCSTDDACSGGVRTDGLRREATCDDNVPNASEVIAAIPVWVRPRRELRQQRRLPRWRMYG